MAKPQLLPFPSPFPKSRYSLSPDEVAELRSLYEELPYAAMRAAEALRVDGKHMVPTTCCHSGAPTMRSPRSSRASTRSSSNSQ
jgi:hypothetical protein